MMPAITPRTRPASDRTAKVIDDKGKKGDANQAVITALIEAGNLFARGRLKHDYPHSWRSKKPIIFRNTPQWFVHMDKDFGDGDGRCAAVRSRASTTPASSLPRARTACAA
jgi:isoleucyl-tRNA synthetase